MDPQPAALRPIPSPPEPPPSTSRDLADPVQLRLALQGHPLQGGQVQHRAAPDVVVVVPAPVEVVVRELNAEVGEEDGPEAEAQAAPTPRTDEQETWTELGAPAWAGSPHLLLFTCQPRAGALLPG